MILMIRPGGRVMKCVAEVISYKNAVHASGACGSARRGRHARQGAHMATRLCEIDDIPFNLQIKGLGDEELLDFWEQTQHIENVLLSEYQANIVPAQDYERLIVLELQLRSCQRPKERRV